MDYYKFDSFGLPYMDTHIPFCNCKGEDALMNSELFRRNRLSLYTSVPFARVSRLLNPRNRYLARRRESQLVDYLICRGDDALAALVLECADCDGDDNSAAHSSLLSPSTHILWVKERNPAFLPVLYLSEVDLLNGAVDPLLNLLDQLLHDTGRIPHKCPIHALTQEEFTRFAAPSKGLLQVSGNVTYITEYGRSLELFRGRFSQSTHRICVFPQSLAMIDKNEFRTEVTLPSVVSFAQRKERIAAGLPCDKTAVMQSIRELGLMPLSVYFRDYPEYLRVFQSALKKDATFQDAARYVAAKMREEQPGICAFNSTLTPGKSLMMYLAEPILSQDS